MKYLTVGILLMLATHLGVYFFSNHFPYWLIIVSFFINMALIIFGTVAYDNPTFKTYYELAKTPKTSTQKASKTLWLIWLITLLMLMNHFAAF